MLRHRLWLIIKAHIGTINASLILYESEETKCPQQK